MSLFNTKGFSSQLAFCFSQVHALMTMQQKKFKLLGNTWGKNAIVGKLEVEQDLATFPLVLQQAAASIGSLGVFFVSKLKNIYIYI